MSPKRPLTFSSVDQARQLLVRQRPYILNKQPLSEPEAIIRKSVEQNIFRTFGGMPQPPSVCFRSWAAGSYARLLRQLQEVTSQEDYDTVIQTHARTLGDHWRREQQAKIGYGPATKMINLLVKAMFLNGALRLLSFATWYNIPFDSFTLRPLVELIDDLLPNLDFTIPMHGQMTMNYVICEEQYHQLQLAVCTLCDGTGKTPFDYELLAWDSRH